MDTDDITFVAVTQTRGNHGYSVVGPFTEAEALEWAKTHECIVKPLISTRQFLDYVEALDETFPEED